MEIREEFLQVIRYAYEYCWNKNETIEKRGYIDLKGMSAVELARQISMNNVPENAVVQMDISINDEPRAWIEWDYRELSSESSRIEQTRKDFFHAVWHQVYLISESLGLKLKKQGGFINETYEERLALYDKYMAGEYGFIIDLFLSYYK